MVIGLVGPWTCLMPPSTASDPPPPVRLWGEGRKGSPRSFPAYKLPCNLPQERGGRPFALRGRSHRVDSLLVSLSAGQAYPSQHPSLAWPLNPYVTSTIKKNNLHAVTQGLPVPGRHRGHRDPRGLLQWGGGHENPPSVRANPCPVHHLRD